MSQATATAVQMPTMFSQTAPGALPTTYVEVDPVQCGQAKIAHMLGIFGILGTGIFYVVKKDSAGTFTKDQMREAFNFHLLVFVVSIGLTVVGSIAAAIVGLLALVFSLASMALMVTAIVMSIMNGLKAGRGEVARYPARLNVLK